MFSDTPRHVLIKGGEGSGKTVAGVVKTLGRLRRGLSGIMVSPDLPHFKKSLWPEFRRWCPWDQVIPRQQHRGRPSWDPHQAFTLNFLNGATLYCGGIDNPAAWEGPNVNFAYMDEARRAADAQPLKVLTGRIRIPARDGSGPPQIWFTTTTRMNWLYEYFGPLVDDDPQEEFKARSLVVTLRTADNEINLQEGFVEDRAIPLSGMEREVYLEGAWGNLDEQERFLANMLWWDACREQLPVLGPREGIVLAADAGVSKDSFGIVGVTRHPDPARRKTDVAVRYSQVWYPPRGGKLDFSVIENELRELCRQYHVVCLAYDPWQLHQMMSNLRRDRVTWVEEFPQSGSKRIAADNQLLDLIMQRHLAHDGKQTELRKHIDNADADRSLDDHRLRLMKRTESLKIDLAVALSMATYQCLRLHM